MLFKNFVAGVYVSVPTPKIFSADSIKYFYADLNLFKGRTKKAVMGNNASELFVPIFLSHCKRNLKFCVVSLFTGENGSKVLNFENICKCFVIQLAS